MEALPAAIGAGGSLISGLMGSNAASAASRQQQASIRRGQDIQAQLALLARDDLAGDRKFHGDALNYLSDVMGLQNNGQGRDPFTAQDPNQYLKMAQPYIEGLQGISGNVANIANMFGGPMGASGQPAWYENALAGFKGTPDYQFARDEALRTGLQAGGTGGNIMGGGRLMGMENRAAGLASQNFGGFRDSIINSILSGGKMALGANDELANLLGKGLNWGTSAMGADDTRYTNYFNRLSTAAGLGSAGVTKSADIASQTGTNLANLMAQEGTAAAKGTIGSANALGTGITGALAPFAGANSPINTLNWGSSSGAGAGSGYGGNSSGDYGGGGDPVNLAANPGWYG